MTRTGFTLLLVACFLSPQLLTAAVTLRLSSTNVNLSLSANGTASAQDDSVSLTGSGSGSATFTTAKAYGTPPTAFKGTQSWLSISTPTTNIAAGGTAVPITVTANPAGLEAGAYTATVTFAVTGSSVVLTVSLTVNGVDLTAGLKQSLSSIAAGQKAAVGEIDVAVTNPNGTNAIQSVQTTTKTDDGGSWLTTSADSALSVNGKGPLIVTVDAANLKAGATHKATVTVNCIGGAPCLSKAVDVTVSVTAPATLNGAPSTLTFNATEGGASPQTQKFTVTMSDNSSQALTITPSTNTGGSWLQAQPSPASTPNSTIAVTATLGSLKANTYTGSLRITAAGGASATITVTFNVASPPPKLTATGDDGTPTVSFPGGDAGVSIIQSATLTVGAQGSGNITFKVSNPTVSWLMISPSQCLASGNGCVVSQDSPQSLIFTFKSNGLQACNPGAPAPYNASCNTTVTVSGGGSSIVIKVSFTLNGVDITAGIGAAFSSVPAGKTAVVGQIKVTISNLNGTAGTQDVQCTPTSIGSWLSTDADGPQGLKTVAGSAPLNVTVDATNLIAGTYQGNIKISCIKDPVTGIGSPCQSQMVQVSVQVANPAAPIRVKPTSLTFTTTAGVTPPSQAVALSTDDNSNVGFSIEQSTSGWLGVAASTSSFTPTSLNVFITNIVNLPASPNPYNTSFQVVPNNGTSKVPVTVSLTVNPAITLAIDTRPITLSAQAGGSCSPVKLSVQSSDSSTVLPFQTQVSNAAWLTIDQPSGNTPSTLSLGCNASALSKGNYSGVVNFSIPNSPLPPVPITVNLAVSDNPLTISPASLTFDYNKSTGASVSGLTQTVQLTTPLAASFSATVSSGQSWLSVTPSSGTTNSTALTIKADPGQLDPSASPYEGAISVVVNRTPSLINVTLELSAIKTVSLVAPLYLDGGGFQTSYLLFNPTSQQASYSVTPNPAMDTSNVSGTLSAGASSMAYETPGTGDWNYGWAGVSYSIGAAGVGLIQATPDRSPQESFIPLQSTPSAHFVTPFDNTSFNGNGSFITQVNLVNSSPSADASCTIQGWRAGAGAMPNLGQVVIPASNSRYVALTDYAGFQGTQGVAEFVCNRQLYAIAMQFSSAWNYNMSAHPMVVVAPTPDSSPVVRVIPALLDGSWHQTVFAIVNTDSVPRNYSFQFFNNRNAGPLGNLLGDQTSGTIPAGGVVYLATDQSGDASSLLSQMSGSPPFAELTAARSVSAMVFYRESVDGATMFADTAAAITQDPASHWTVPLSGTQGFTTALNIVNSNNATNANVILHFYGTDGTPLGSETITVPGGGASLIQAQNDPLLSGLDGLLDVSSDQMINGMFFRIAPNGSFAVLWPLPAN